MLNTIRLRAPLSDDLVTMLASGDQVLIDGVVYTARDAAHQRLVALLREAQPLPVDLQGQILYYVGPSPARPGRVIGAAGPTTASRMDVYTPTLLQLGLKAMIGKGKRSAEVIAALKQYKAVYLGATGGAGALLSRCILRAEVVAFPDLGPEAIYRLEVKDFPAVVINDCQGRDWYDINIKQYARSGV